MQEDPNFRDHVLLYEYFHGDNGRGVGASHKTGWTGLAAKLLRQSEDKRSKISKRHLAASSRRLSQRNNDILPIRAKPADDK